MRLGQVDVTSWISGFLDFTSQSCGLAGVFSMEPVVLWLWSVAEVFGPPPQLGLEPEEPAWDDRANCGIYMSGEDCAGRPPGPDLLAGMVPVRPVPGHCLPGRESQDIWSQGWEHTRQVSSLLFNLFFQSNVCSYCISKKYSFLVLNFCAGFKMSISAQNRTAARLFNHLKAF